MPTRWLRWCARTLRPYRRSSPMMKPVLDLLVTEREGALAEATRLRNQIHQLLLQIDPQYKAHLPSLKTQAALELLTTYTTTSQSALDQQRAARSEERRVGKECRSRWSPY